MCACVCMCVISLIDIFYECLVFCVSNILTSGLEIAVYGMIMSLCLVHIIDVWEKR